MRLIPTGTIKLCGWPVKANVLLFVFAGVTAVGAERMTAVPAAPPGVIGVISPPQAASRTQGKAYRKPALSNATNRADKPESSNIESQILNGIV
jgi:hypothetical protein